MKIKWINHKGKRILYADYSGLSEQDMIKQLDEGSAMLLKEKDSILYFGNFNNTVFTSEFMNKANQWGKDTNHKFSKMAIIGVATGIRSILLNSYNKLTGSKMKVFTSEQEALDYLAQ